MKPNLEVCRNRKKDCFANKNGSCIALSDTVFLDSKGKKTKCPFYKKEGQEDDIQPREK